MKPKKSSANKRLRLNPKQLRRHIQSRSLPSAKALSKHRTHIIGQDRAISALELGLRLESPGYNIFISGPSGSGRMTTARHILKGFKQPRRPLKDYAYVYNFQEPDRPRLLELAPGQGQKLKKTVDHLVKTLKRELPRATSTEHCQKERDRVLSDYQRKEHELVSSFQDKVSRAKFMAVEVQSGPIVEHDVLPVIDGEPQPLAVIEEKVEKGEMSRRQFKQLQKKHSQLRTELEKIHRRTRSLAREMTEQLEEIDRRTGTAVIDAIVGDIRDAFKEETVQDFLDDAREALLDRIPALVRRADEDERGEANNMPGYAIEPADPLEPFQVNVVLNNARHKACPVVFENTPTLVRLFGTIERSVDDAGRQEVDFMNIRAGSMLRANGGFLVVQAEELLPEPGVWKTLKSTLSSGKLEIRVPEGPMAMVTSGLKPDPVPLDIKIIMLGDELLYRTLYMAEDDFKKTFKVKAEFDVEMNYSKANLEKFMAFIQRVVKEEELLQPTRPAIALLAEEAMRDVEDQRKLTTRFRVVADLLRESTYWAGKCSRRSISPDDVRKAVLERKRRFNLAEEKYRENIMRDVVIVTTTESMVAQVNGLAVFDLGDYSFGKPCRITATVGIGDSGVINIERESGLSGEIHDKGIYILSGFLRSRFGQQHPLALDASVCFEQSYGEVDGDSASSTEVYAIMSALSELPIAQEIAVTGSVNQQGEVQAIGGVNNKIEGFYDICNSRGLTGKQGVIIPKSNIEHLMLDEEVVDAVRRGRFHVWSVSTIDEGMELLTGVTAGRPDSKGKYPAGTVNRMVSDRLETMAKSLRDYR
ncbi:MAG: AAA family ATPase [Deltaproteobacteria bacterium]|nr:AAA family ATPase [Deltaproteobacteria bacterium]